MNPLNDSPNDTAYRVVQRDDRLGIHRVQIDASGAVVDWDPEPVRLEITATGTIVDDWRLGGMAFGAANATFVMTPRLLYRDGQLIEITAAGGDDAQPVRARVMLEG